MTRQRQRLGSWGERIARKYLEERGYRILETNYRRPEGEIDIVTQQGETPVFVEVRTRRGDVMGLPEESVTRSKQNKLREVAQSYLQWTGQESASWRIDFVAVELTPAGRLKRVELIQNAIQDDLL